ISIDWPRRHFMMYLCRAPEQLQLNLRLCLLQPRVRLVFCGRKSSAPRSVLPLISRYLIINGNQSNCHNTAVDLDNAGRPREKEVRGSMQSDADPEVGDPGLQAEAG